MVHPTTHNLLFQLRVSLFCFLSLSSPPSLIHSPIFFTHPLCPTHPFFVDDDAPPLRCSKSCLVETIRSAVFVTVPASSRLNYCGLPPLDRPTRFQGKIVASADLVSPTGIPNVAAAIWSVRWIFEIHPRDAAIETGEPRGIKVVSIFMGSVM